MPIGVKINNIILVVKNRVGHELENIQQLLVHKFKKWENRILHF